MMHGTCLIVRTLVHEYNGRCVVCQLEYDEGEKLVALPCDHPYHCECITTWLQIKKVPIYVFTFFNYVIPLAIEIITMDEEIIFPAT